MSRFVSFALAGLVAVGLAASAGASAETVGVALVTDGPSRAAWNLEEPLVTELRALLDGELELDVLRFEGDWTRRGLVAALERAWNDPAVDLVLVTGLVGNQVFGTFDTFPKPTFLPLVADAELFGLPRAGAGSGRENLSYLSDEIGFERDLESFLDLAPMRDVTLLVDRVLFEVVTSVRTRATRVAEAAGVDLTIVPYADPDADLLALVPENADGVMIDGLARLDEAAVDRLIDGLVARRLPSFSLMGPELVERGLLVANTQTTEIQRIARRNALAMQAVALGEPAAEQRVDFDAKQRLLVNLETARAIDVWPRYRVLVEAKLLGGDIGRGGAPLSITDAAREALRANLDLLAETYGVDAGAEDIRAARAAFLPQVELVATGVRLNDDSLGVVSGMAAERSLSGSLTVRQLLFSESARANVSIQRSAQASRLAELDAFRLDVVQSATLAFLDVLRAETQFRIQRTNLDRTQSHLELARDRVRVGSSSAADAYRWESELATARQNAISAHARRLQARERLNRVLHRDLTETLDLNPPTLDDGELFTSSDELEALVDNPRGFRLVSEILVEKGIERAPELTALGAAIDAKQREVDANRRAFYLPDVALQGQLDEILDESARATGAPSQQGRTDWSLGLSATLPLFEGGARDARLGRAELELEQLRARLDATREAIELNIRSALHAAIASYSNIELAEEGAGWAAKNLDLVTDLYAKGAVDILQLLDAQSAAVQADEAASNAVFDFVVDLMNANRAVGHFDFLLDSSERRELLDELMSRIATGAPDAE